jgi:hypothetical protein
LRRISHDPAIHQHTQSESQKNERRNNSEMHQNDQRATLHKVKIFTGFPAKSSGEG